MPERPPPPGIDVTKPGIARVCDFWPGGKDNFAAVTRWRDEELAPSGGDRQGQAELGLGVGPPGPHGEAGGRQLLPPGARLEVDRHEPQPLGDAESELHQAAALPGLRTRAVDLEDPHSRGNLRPPLGKGVEASSQKDVLADAPVGLLCDKILDMKRSPLKVNYKPYSADDARQFVKNRIGARGKAEKGNGP